tara:strand:+ start:2353 stop:2901 length:549 start_codon:yes stop_codon:yes gene_type:complete
MFDQQLIDKMNVALKHFEKELSSLRTSRASPDMLNNIVVEAYGSKTQINQLGNISVPDSSTLSIQVWDNTMTKSIENAILESSLGLNPQVDGQLIRLPIPKLSEERRKELTKVASEYAERSKVSIRNIRRDFIEAKKRDKKDNNLSEDELKKYINEVQKSTDEYTLKIDNLLEDKRNDIMKV